MSLYFFVVPVLPDETFTIEEAAVFLRKSVPTLRDWIRGDPTLPFSKKGKEYIFLRSDLEAWLRADYSANAKRVLRG